MNDHQDSLKRQEEMRREAAEKSDATQDASNRTEADHTRDDARALARRVESLQPRPGAEEHARPEKAAMIPDAHEHRPDSREATSVRPSLKLSSHDFLPPTAPKDLKPETLAQGGTVKDDGGAAEKRREKWENTAEVLERAAQPRNPENHHRMQADASTAALVVASMAYEILMRHVRGEK